MKPILTFCICASLAALACGGSQSSGGFGADASPGGGGGTTANDAGTLGSNDAGTLGSAPPLTDDSGTLGLSGGDGSTSSNGDCPVAAGLIYVTGEGSQLYSFYPPTLKFTLIGTLTCLGSPTHMTVDRTGTAWVVGSDANDDSPSMLYTASTTNAACSAVSTWTVQPETFPDFALSFIGTTSATDNSLYILGAQIGAAVSAPGPLGLFNTATGALTILGTPNVAANDPGGDMTSNGDGALYFLEASDDLTPLNLYAINPSNAAITGTTSLPTVLGGGGQALAFWGGSFYMFEDTVVYQYDPTTGGTAQVGTAPLSVTGAGQSTCVPTTGAPPVPPPK